MKIHLPAILGCELGGLSAAGRMEHFGGEAGGSISSEVRKKLGKKKWPKLVGALGLCVKPMNLKLDNLRSKNHQFGLAMLGWYFSNGYPMDGFIVGKSPQRQPPGDRSLQGVRPWSRRSTAAWHGKNSPAMTGKGGR